MRTLFALFLISLCLCWISGHAQQQDIIQVKSTEEAINTTIKKFRERIADENARIYCIVEAQLKKQEINVTENDLFLENNLNPKYLESKKTCFLLKFLVSIEKQGVFISVLKWRITKHSNKKLEYTDIMSRDYYKLAI